MADAYIIDAVRSPMGRFGGGLSHLHPADLGANILSGLIDRTGVDPAAVDDCIMGCVGQIGAQAFNVARNAWLSAGLPEHVPAVTIDRQCGSSQQAVHFAAQGIMSGTQDLVVAGGVEVMSLIHLNSPGRCGPRSGHALPVRRRRLGQSLRRRRGPPVPGRQPHRRALGRHLGRHERPGPAQPPERRPGLGRRALRAGGVGGGRMRPRRGHPARYLYGEDGQAAPILRARPADRGQLQPDHRRLGRPAHRLRESSGGAWPQPPEPGSTPWQWWAATRC